MAAAENKERVRYIPRDGFGLLLDNILYSAAGSAVRMLQLICRNPDPLLFSQAFAKA